LTAALFLINAFHVWEFMVLRTGKETANLLINMLLQSMVPSTYSSNNVCNLTSALLVLSLLAKLRCDLV